VTATRMTQVVGSARRSSRSTPERSSTSSIDRRSSRLTSSEVLALPGPAEPHNDVDAGYGRRYSALISPVLSEHHLRSRTPPADAVRIEGRRSSIDAPHKEAVDEHRA
jgi:hypothetical protein